jgi:LPS O-antigen subunit length determinant protein (WzzB/FepE family)
MSTTRFDIVDVAQTLRAKRRTIIIVTIVAGILGAAFYLVSKKKYKAEGSFLMTNPLYTDRNNLFQSWGINFVDYFAGDDDVDRIMTVVESDTVKRAVAEKLNLAAAYGLDVSKPKEAKKLMDIVKDNYKVVRTEYNNCDVSYVDTDPQRAAEVVNESMRTIEQIFRGYYIDQRNRMIAVLNAQVATMDSSINVLTDSLANMRDRYGIYSIINPARENLQVSDVKGGGAGFGRGIEEIQNIESVKDQLVIDRTKFISRINEYKTTQHEKDVKLLHILSSARPPAKAKPPGLTLTTLSCALIGFFFSCIYLLISTYYRRIIVIER